MKKNVTAIAMAVASIVSQESFGTAISAGAVSLGSQVQIGCTLPASGGATVYSIDNYQIGTGGAAQDTITLPSVVAINASCTVAINAMNSVTNLTGSASGKWNTSVAGTPVGVSPAGLTQSNSGYSLQAFTFVAQ